MNLINRALLLILFAVSVAAAQTRTTDNGWPRKFAIGTNSVAVYQPQTEEWSGNSFSARAAIAITESSGKQPLYGVVWFAARADVDQVNASGRSLISDSRESTFQWRPRRPLLSKPLFRRGRTNRAK